MKTKVLPINNFDAIRAAVNYLSSGELVALPTETVYGLAADATNLSAIRKIYEVKSRPLNHPLIVHLADIDQLPIWTKNIPDDAYRLASLFWPGPLTMLLEKQNSVFDELTASSPFVCVRIPKNQTTLEVIRKLGTAIVAPSANKFGFVSPTSAEHVKQDLLNKIPLVLDGGSCNVGIESTIIDFTKKSPRILRPGGLLISEIEKALNRKVLLDSNSKNKVSGALKNHYQPNAHVFLMTPKQLDNLRTANIEKTSAFFLLKTRKNISKNIFILPRNSLEYGSMLYSLLRSVDAAGYKKIIIETPPSKKDWLAVRDRITKAEYKNL